MRIQYIVSSFFILVITQPTNSDSGTVHDCIHQIVQYATEKGDLLGYYSSLSKKQQRRLLPLAESPELLQTLMLSGNGTFRTFQNLKPVTPKNFVKQQDISLLVIWLNYYKHDIYMEMLKSVKTHRVIGPLTKVVIFVDAIFDESIRAMVIKELFSGMWEQFKRYHSIVLMKEKEEICIYKFFPLKNLLSGSKMGECLENVNKSIFNELPRILNNYPCKLGYYTRPPYVVPPNKPGGPPGGNEIMIVRTIAESIKMNVIYKTTSHYIEPVQAILEDKINGVYQMAYDNEVDIVVADLSLIPEEGPLISFIYPCMIGDYLYTVPSPRKLPNWRCLYSAFSIEVWVSVSATSVAFALALYGVSQRFSHKRQFLHYLITVLIALLGVRIPDEIIQKTAKSIICLLLLYVIVATTVYKAGFTATLSQPYSPQLIKNLQDGLDLGLSIYIHPAWYQALDLDNPFWIKADKAGRVIVTDNFTLQAYKTGIDRVGMFASSTDISNYVLNMEFGPEGGASLIDLLEAEQESFPVYFIMPPGHPLQPIFNEKIFNVMEGGLPDLWLKKVLHKTWLKEKSIPKKNIGPLSINDLLVSFYIVSILLVINIGVCCIEIVYYRTKKSKHFYKKKECCNRMHVAIVTLIPLPVRLRRKVKRRRVWQ